MNRYITTALILFLLWSCKNKTDDTLKPKTTPPTVVDVIVAGIKNLNNNIEVNGSVLANEMLDIHPEVSGRLTYLNVLFKIMDKNNRNYYVL